MPEAPLRPVVLSIAGHDPTGGAGIQADIEAIASQGCHAATVVTALTVQDTRDVQAVIPIAPASIAEQCRTLMADLVIRAIKLGLIPSVEIAQTVAALLDELPGVPVVLDPVLASGAGTPLSDQALRRSLRESLLPRTTLLTPNSREARQLAEQEDLDDCGRTLLALGCAAVLITGAHESGPRVVNRLYLPDGRIDSVDWERLPGSYHGSGCTLAASIAALLARGLELGQAVHQAQGYTWNSLRHAFQPGRGQALPNRFYRQIP